MKNSLEFRCFEEEFSKINNEFQSSILNGENLESTDYIFFIQKVNKFIKNFFSFVKKIDSTLNEVLNISLSKPSKEKSIEESLEIKQNNYPNQNLKNIEYDTKVKKNLNHNSINLNKNNYRNEIQKTEKKISLSKEKEDFSGKKEFSNNNLINTITLKNPEEFIFFIKQFQYENSNLSKQLHRANSVILYKNKNISSDNLLNATLSSRKNKTIKEEFLLLKSEKSNIKHEKDISSNESKMLSRYIKPKNILNQNNTLEVQFYDEYNSKRPGVLRNKSSNKLISNDSKLKKHESKYNENTQNIRNVNNLYKMLNKHYKDLDRFYQKYGDKYNQKSHSVQSNIRTLSNFQIEKNNNMLLKSLDK